MGEARDALLAGIVNHYAARGVRDTSLRTLASAVETSQRMLNYHFGSREDVLTAVIDVIAGQQARQIGALFAQAADPFEAGRRNWDETVAGAQVFGPLWFELASHAMHDTPSAGRLREVMVAAQLREFTRLYAEHTTPGHAASLARLTLAVGRGLVFSLLLDGDRVGADRAISEFTTMVRRALSDS